MFDALPRCPWCGDDPLYTAYHDTDWGVPERCGRALWEKLVLDGFQAGLAWITILRKREAFRRAFAGFDPAAVAAFGEDDVARLLADPGIVRHRGKIEATLRGARVVADMGTDAFGAWCWDRVGGAPIRNRWDRMDAVPAATPLSTRMSKELKAMGFGFVGPTIVYAWMQACGLVNDHLTFCYRHAEVDRLG